MLCHQPHGIGKGSQAERPHDSPMAFVGSSRKGGGSVARTGGLLSSLGFTAFGQETALAAGATASGGARFAGQDTILQQLDDPLLVELIQEPFFATSIPAGT